MPFFSRAEHYSAIAKGISFRIVCNQDLTIVTWYCICLEMVIINTCGMSGFSLPYRMIGNILRRIRYQMDIQFDASSYVLILHINVDYPSILCIMVDRNPILKDYLTYIYIHCSRCHNKLRWFFPWVWNVTLVPYI